MRKKLNPEFCHDVLSNNMIPSLSFNEKADYSDWKAKVKDKFLYLTGLYDIMKNACPLNFEIEEEKQKDGYKQIRFTVETEKYCIVPCYILIPDNIKDKAPVCITLQGHSSGFHNSIGEPKTDSDKEYSGLPDGRGAFAYQAVKKGYIAVAIEQRGMGEQMPTRWNYQWAGSCAVTAFRAFEMGRTVLGERMWDVSKVIDALSHFPECDLDDITITGNSGGGTMSFYAACFDERIKFSAPSCAFCSYKTSIMSVYHCSCNYIPHALKYFDMPDLACLIAPRKLTIISGQQDKIFPVESVVEDFKKVQAIYEKENAPLNCKLVQNPEGHFWKKEVVWNEIDSMRKD